MTVMAFDPKRTTNAQLMVDCLELGYLPTTEASGGILDATYGLGSFWKGFEDVSGVGLYKVNNDEDDWIQVCQNDLDPELGYWHEDFRNLGWDDRSWHTVVFDPPYKLNGTPTPSVDDRYGVGKTATVVDRIQLIIDGVTECARVSNRFLLVKVQDQVAGGRVRWMTAAVNQVFQDLYPEWARKDELYVSSYRPQPSGRTQLHARRNYSTLMVFERTQ